MCISSVFARRKLCDVSGGRVLREMLENSTLGSDAIVTAEMIRDQLFASISESVEFVLNVSSYGGICMLVI
ncbi:hypothetical protein MRB53_038761 [Persea americana]|nr:hypothetical protein MRB53_038761 [Persea americana]